ncbi:hypothetical protein GCM10020221_20240 [Streptomyces thioluteus]|uniref:Short-chain fatty acyl coenzyme A regulators C-terminal domain-containing protein n=1 Tax=Streptomyces thioluteus TaxID=66431 RepID=A0ABN3WQE9_STRTU
MLQLDPVTDMGCACVTSGLSSTDHVPVALGSSFTCANWRHATRLVYPGVALDDPRAATPIGLGCRICERRDCAQRARPPAGGRPAIDPDRRTYVPYQVENSSP